MEKHIKILRNVGKKFLSRNTNKEDLEEAIIISMWRGASSSAIPLPVIASPAKLLLVLSVRGIHDGA